LQFQAGVELLWFGGNWEQIQNQREENGEFPVPTWAEMKKGNKSTFCPETL